MERENICIHTYVQIYKKREETDVIKGYVSNSYSEWYTYLIVGDFPVQWNCEGRTHKRISKSNSSKGEVSTIWMEIKAEEEPSR